MGYEEWDPEADATRRGVTRQHPSRAAPGYNLYTNDVDEVYLVDIDGNRLHTWRLEDKRHCEYAELLEDGNLAVVCAGQGVTLLDWHSDVVWEVRMAAHHDVAVLPDGSLLVPYQAETRSHLGRTVIFDGIARLSADGRRQASWSSFEHLDELRRHHPARRPDSALTAPSKAHERSEPSDYYHLNSIQVLPETPLGARDPRFRPGNLLICLRNVDTLLVLDQDDYSVTWHWGAGQLELPHMPSMLENGHILVFDNGTRRGFSRVLEVDPSNGEVVWKFEATPSESFFTAWRGSSQRLPNGNTLICESQRGHVFEVTRDGTVVWEFWNPELVGKRRKRIYRFLRLPAAEVEPWLERFAGDG